jgi:ORF6N domain-containing protein
MSKEIVSIEDIARSIFTIHGQKVMLDFDLAALCGIPTGHLNRAVKRNIGRFPVDFMFQLGAEEAGNLKCQFGISSWDRRSRSSL